MALARSISSAMFACSSCSFSLNFFSPWSAGFSSETGFVDSALVTMFVLMLTVNAPFDELCPTWHQEKYFSIVHTDYDNKDNAYLEPPNPSPALLHSTHSVRSFRFYFFWIGQGSKLAVRRPGSSLGEDDAGQRRWTAISLSSIGIDESLTRAASTGNHKTI